MLAVANILYYCEEGSVSSVVWRDDSRPSFIFDEDLFIGSSPLISGTWQIMINKYLGYYTMLTSLLARY